MILIKLILTALSILIMLMIHSLENAGIVSGETSTLLHSVKEYSNFFFVLMGLGVVFMYRKQLLKLLMDKEGTPFSDLDNVPKNPMDTKAKPSYTNIKPTQDNKQPRVAIKALSSQEKRYHRKKDDVFLDEDTIWIDKDR